MGPDEQILCGKEPYITISQLELLAAIRSLQFFKNSQVLTIITDSMYVKKGITEWISTWKNNNWRNALNKPIKNQEMWEELNRLNDYHTVQWQWIRARYNNKNNKYCDKIAKQQAQAQLLLMR